MILKHTIAALALCAAMPAVQAATIAFNPQGGSVIVGDTIEVTIVGESFTAGAGGTVGGGLSVSWDPTLLSLEAYDTDGFGGDKLFANDNTTTTLDATAGTLSDLSVLSFNGVADANFEIASLIFKGLATGVSGLGLSIGQFDGGAQNLWFDSLGFDPAAPAFAGTDLTVQAVPLPAAVWLLGSAVMGLMGTTGRARHRTA